MNKQYGEVNNLINSLSSEINNLALAIKENVGGYFNYLQGESNANKFVDYLQNVSQEVKDLTNNNYSIQVLTENLKNKINKINDVTNEMGVVALQRYPLLNGGTAFKALSRNTENLSLIIEKLGTIIQETETTLIANQNVTNQITTELENYKLKVSDLNLEITDLKNKLNDSNKRVSDFNSSIIELSDNLSNKQNEINHLQKNIDENKVELNDNVVKMKELQNKLNYSNIETGKFKDKLDEINLAKANLIKEKEYELNSMNLKIKDLEDKLNHYKIKIENLEKEKILLNDVNSKLKEELSKLKQNNKELEQEIINVKVQNKLETSKLIIEILKEKGEELNSIKENNNRLIKEYEDNLTRVSSNLKIKENRIVELEEELERNNLEKNRTRAELDKLKDDKEELKVIITQYNSLDTEQFLEIVVEKYESDVNSVNAEIVKLLGSVYNIR